MGGATGGSYLAARWAASAAVLTQLADRIIALSRVREETKGYSHDRY